MGHYNRKTFVQFLFYAATMLLYASWKFAWRALDLFFTSPVAPALTTSAKFSLS